MNERENTDWLNIKKVLTSLYKIKMKKSIVLNIIKVENSKTLNYHTFIIFNTIEYNKGRKLQDPKLSHIFNETLVFSVIAANVVIMLIEYLNQMKVFRY